MASAEPKFTLQVLWQSEDSIRVTPFKEGTALESTLKTSRTCSFHSELVAERAREILAILTRANAGQDGLMKELVEAGRAIYVDLLPSFLKEKLQEARAPNLVLHLDKPLVGIPWELLHDGDDFLGRRFRLGRLVTVDEESAPPMQRRMAPPLSVLIVADPSGDLPAAQHEAHEVESLLEDSPVIGSVTTLTGRVALRTLRDELPKHDILHYAGHADFDDRSGEAQLRLSDGALSTKLIDQVSGRVDFPGLVFLNACRSADEMGAGPAGSHALGPAGVASSLLLAGVRHVVGTLWEVRDEVARHFARSFYRSLGASETVGVAMERARHAIAGKYGEDRLFWADHLLYGDPTWRLESPRNLTFDDMDVLDGLEARYRAELFSEDGATRLLAAAMLLRLGDRSVASAVQRDLSLLESWISPHASRKERRQAALVAHALASAAGLCPVEPPGEAPDIEAVRRLLGRLSG
ncbi:MAG: CHAT domain-containing protein [Planctomycetota bacterium]|jgi:CHAT domain-containing protein|nr:CHAT domain-containing protein [Planctomycetota bacterium]